MSDPAFAIDVWAMAKRVREAWVEWAKTQPDVAEHPNWIVPWEDLPSRDRIADAVIADTVMKACSPKPCETCAHYVEQYVEQSGWCHHWDGARKSDDFCSDWEAE